MVRTLLSVLLACAVHYAFPYTLRQLDTGDGMSNSAVLSMCQDARGFMWMGTCDGLNIYDGRDITVFNTSTAGEGLSGDLVEDVLECGDGSFWVLTNYGLNHLTPDGHVRNYPQFMGLHNLVSGMDGSIFVADRKGDIFYYLPDGDGTFARLRMDIVADGEALGLSVYGSTLWMFTTGGIIRTDLERGSDALRATGSEVVCRRDFTDAFVHGDDIHLVDPSWNLYKFSPSDGKLLRVAELRHLVKERGHVKDVVGDRHGHLFAGFSEGGVTRLELKDESGDFIVEDLGVKGGVFCLSADRFQDVVWIGSDGHGVYMYANDTYSLRSITYSDLGNIIMHPVRSIYLDGENTLWLGTKGNGLLLIRNFNPWGRGDGYERELITASRSGLRDNSVYAVVPGRRGGVWIGSEDGVSYASADGRTVRPVKTDGDIRYVHSIYESDDSTLWLATVGLGVIRARIGGSVDAPALSTEKTYVLDGGNFASNFFFALHHDSEGRIWAGNRGFGLFRIEGDDIRNVPFGGACANKTVNDVFAVAGTGSDLWVGTGYGLFNLTPGGERMWVRNQGFPNSTIHAILPDSNGKNMWVATNAGLVCVDKEGGNYRTFTHNSGLDVLEFSDGAAYKNGSTLFFGGVDGIAVIRENMQPEKEGKTSSMRYIPAIHFTRLNIAGTDVRLESRISAPDGISTLRLGPSENTFSISFVVPDHMSADNYTYLYRFGGEKEWIQVTTPGTVSFTSMPYGDYVLDIKAVNHSTGTESAVKTLRIDISAPWYLSIPAKTFCLLVAAFLAWTAVRRRRRRRRQAQEAVMRQLEQEHKEKSYEEKLRFFTNITHEFCTPLTLIYGPCERILSYGDADPYVRRYASLIKNNTERLNSLIQEIIDFRRVETGNQKTNIRNIDISGLCNDIIATFDDLRERQNVDLRSEISPEIIWPTDYGCFTKIVYNLISNAFKYTPSGGTVKVGLRTEGGHLLLSVYNTGKGIKPEDRKLIFNRYSILDNVEENATRTLSSRNGLGMAICHSMTELLKGEIDIESEVGRYAMFIVSLPRLEITEGAESADTQPAQQLPAGLLRSDIGYEAGASQQEAPGNAITQPDDGVKKPRVLVIDDNPDILTLMSDSLPEYRVLTAQSAEEGLKIIRDNAPDLIITDIMMPGVDGLELTKQIKQDRHMRNIPLVILSARNSTDDRVEGLQSGADAYIPKPFPFSYLRAVVTRLLAGKSEMQEYYNTSSSAFRYMHGRLVDKEESGFVDALNNYIESNIDNSELSPASMAAHMQTSTRGLYRKMKELQLLPPNDYIKEHRLAFATKLLVTTSLTIQEIIYRCGFSNRSHFYKEFDRRFGMTPKDYRLQHRVSGSAPDSADTPE